MPTITATNPTLLDLAKAMDPDGKIATIVELQNQVNEILDDMTFVEGNLLTGHRTTIRTGLPTPTWRKLYGGVQPTKSTNAQVDDTCGMLEDYAEIDAALADLNGLASSFMMSENKPHLEGMNQEFAANLFYGNEAASPEKFTGLAPRFNDSAAASGHNIIKAGGSSNNTSIWLVVWSPETVHGIIPKGSKAGWQMDYKGKVTIENADGSGGRMEAYRTHYRWDVGLTVRDWRYVVRIANIDVTALTKDAASGADLPDLMAEAEEMVPSLTYGRPAWYMNRTCRSFLRRQVASKIKGSTLSEPFVAGKHILAFDEIPVRRCDQILKTETTVS